MEQGDEGKMGSGKRREREGKEKDGGVGLAVSVGGTSVCSLGDYIEEEESEERRFLLSQREKLPQSAA